MNIRTVIRLVLEIVGIGLPPEIEDKDALQQWVKDVAIALKKFAALTKPKADDTIADLLLSIVNTQSSWDLIYELLIVVANGKDPEPILASAEQGVYGAIDPVTILAIVKMIIEIINMFKDEPRPKPPAAEEDEDDEDDENIDDTDAIDIE